MARSSWRWGRGPKPPDATLPGDQRSGDHVTIPERADTYYMADLAVTCAPREPGRRMLLDPVLVVEVLPPWTGRVDRWRKVTDYRGLPSVQEIVVVFSDERRVEVQRRAQDGWREDDLIGQASDRALLLRVADPARRGVSDVLLDERQDLPGPPL